MNLTVDDARDRARRADHGVLGTTHPTRGIDLVPIVFALDRFGDRDVVGIPVDTVKPKASTRLQRERNLESDSRATLLVDQWDAVDWTRLWWVRAHLVAVAEPGPEIVERLAARLASGHAQYRERPFARILVFEVASWAGWSGDPSGEIPPAAPDAPGQLPT